MFKHSGEHSVRVAKGPKLSFQLAQYLSRKQTVVSFSRMTQTTLSHHLEIPQKVCRQIIIVAKIKSVEMKITSNSGMQQKEKENSNNGKFEAKNVQLKESLVAGTNLSC